MNVRNLVFGTLLAFALVTLVAAQTTGNSNYPIESDISMFTVWIPVIVLAIMLSVCIVIVYYLLGMVLNNARMRAMAISEFTNAIATALIVCILLITFSFFGTAASNPLVSGVPASTISTICTQLQNAHILFLNSQSGSAAPSPTSQVCSNLVQSSSATSSIDYGLVSTYVITANLTEQAAENLNAAYMFSGYMSFLAAFTADASACAPTVACIGTYEPGATFINASIKPFVGYLGVYKSLNPATTQSTLVFTMFMFQVIAILTFLFLWPYLLAAGIILRATFFTRRLGGLLIAIVVVAILVYPAIFLMEYSALSNAGIQPIGANTFGNNAIPVLTIGSTTSPISGPNGIYACNDESGTTFQSTACTSGTTSYVCNSNTNGVESISSSPCATGAAASNLGTYVCTDVAGAETIQSAACPSGTTTTYICTTNGVTSTSSSACGSGSSSPTVSYQSNSLNFYVFPSMSAVLNYYGCWPHGGLIAQELAVAGTYSLPAYGFASVLTSIGSSAFSGAYSILPIPFFNCYPQNAISSMFGIYQVLGLMSVLGVIFPILNLLLAISATFGISDLLGGATDIFGLSRLI